MGKKNTEEHDFTGIDLKAVRIRKKVLKETDSDSRDAVEFFLEKFINDTLTGL